MDRNESRAEPSFFTLMPNSLSSIAGEERIVVGDVVRGHVFEFQPLDEQLFKLSFEIHTGPSLA